MVGQSMGEAVKIFFELIPACVQKALYYQSLDSGRLERIAELADNQSYIRRMLSEKGLCAFVADGAVLRGNREFPRSR